MLISRTKLNEIFSINHEPWKILRLCVSTHAIFLFLACCRFIECMSFLLKKYQDSIYGYFCRETWITTEIKDLGLIYRKWHRKVQAKVLHQFFFKASKTCTLLQNGYVLQIIIPIFYILLYVNDEVNFFHGSISML